MTEPMPTPCFTRFPDVPLVGRHRVQWRRVDKPFRLYLPRGISLTSAGTRWQVRGAGLAPRFVDLGDDPLVSLSAAWQLYTQRLLDTDAFSAQPCTTLEELRARLPDGISVVHRVRSPRNQSIALRYTHRLRHPEAEREHVFFTVVRSLQHLRKEPSFFDSMYAAALGALHFAFARERAADGLGLSTLAFPEAIELEYHPQPLAPVIALSPHFWQSLEEETCTASNM